MLYQIIDNETNNKVVYGLKFISIKKITTRLFFTLFVVTLVYQVGRTFFLEQEHDIRDGAYELMQLLFVEAFDKAYDQYGLFCFNGPQKPMQKCTGAVAKNSVILIHGLDEPGLIFTPLASMLYRKGYPVLFFFYPDDQRIDASSRLLFKNLSSLSFDGPAVLIAHSMGGIVSRQMLTAPDIGYQKACTLGKVPEISDLIMVGTPNHGAFLARFRMFMEIREQFLLAAHGRWHPLCAFTDGTGAAGVDLLPGSDFMKSLNSRPFPEQIQLHMIAGRIIPFPVNMPKQFQITEDQAVADLPGPQKNYFIFVLGKISFLMGDGLVSINSAVPLDVPVTLLNADHRTLLKNFSADNPAMPPAIPVIVDILENR